MERQLDYDAFTREKTQRFAGLKADMGYRRGARRRPRDPDELRSLMELDLARLHRMCASGERRWVAPRIIELR